MEDGIRLARLLDVDGQGRLLVTATGFALLAGKKLQWFTPDGETIGEVTTRDPIRRVYATKEGAAVETRQHRAIVAGLELA